jgi:hypothetical protein
MRQVKVAEDDRQERLRASNPIFVFRDGALASDRTQAYWKLENSGGPALKLFVSAQPGVVATMLPSYYLGTNSSGGIRFECTGTAISIPAIFEIEITYSTVTGIQATQKFRLNTASWQVSDV